jgi:hypothetical protein
MTPVARFDTQTLFQIDPQWLKEDSQSARKEIHACLCDDCRARYPDPEVARAVDRVHPLTGEVTRVDVLWESVVDHCARQPDYISATTPLSTGIFRALLANGNQPMSSEQLYQRIRKNSAEGILRMLNKGTDIEFVVPAASAKV